MSNLRDAPLSAPVPLLLFQELLLTALGFAMVVIRRLEACPAGQAPFQQLRDQLFRRQHRDTIAEYKSALYVTHSVATALLTNKLTQAQDAELPETEELTNALQAIHLATARVDTNPRKCPVATPRYSSSRQPQHLNIYRRAWSCSCPCDLTCLCVQCLLAL